MLPNASTSLSLEVHLLGPFRVSVDGTPVEERRWARRHAKLLVKILALQPHHQLHREQMMELLWPEHDPASSANNLHKTIHAARRALEPTLKSGADSHFIITQGQQIRLRAPGKLWIDVDQFEQQAAEAIKSLDTQLYEAALALYEGDLLIEDLYEDWATARREQLRALHEDLLLKLAQLSEAQGQHQKGIDRLKEVVACDPSNEEAHWQLMRLYALIGSRHQALQQYQQCREALRKELDAEPDEATVALYEQIVSGQIKPLSLESSTAEEPGGSRIATEEGSTDIHTEAAEPSVRAKAVRASRAKHRWEGWRRSAILFAGSMLLVGLVAALFYPWISLRKQPETVTGARVIAVLPFKPISTQSRDPYLELGMADALITKLSRISRLIVRPISAVRKYTELQQDPVAAGREQGVEAVLDANVQELDDRIRVTARLVSVKDGRALWTGAFETKSADRFLLQDAIAEQMTRALALKLTPQEKERLAKHDTEDATAYQLYQKGRYFWNRRTEDDLKKGIEYFQLAIQHDPNYALAYAGLADCYTVLGVFETLPSEELFPKAKDAAVKALMMDDTLAEAHTSLAFAIMNYDWDWSGAEREFHRAIERNPSYTTAHSWYSLWLTAMGRHNDAIAEVKRSQALDPPSLIVSSVGARAFYLARQYDQTIEQCRKILEMDSNFWVAHLFLGKAYGQEGMYEPALAELQKASNLYRGSTLVISEIGYIYAVSGQHSAAQQALDELKSLSKQKYVAPTSLAMIYTGLNEKDQAFEWLERAYASRDLRIPFLKVMPEFDRLHSDPRFQDLLRRVGLAPRIN